MILSLRTHHRVSREVVIVSILHTENGGSEKSRNLSNVMMTDRHKHIVQSVFEFQLSLFWKTSLPGSGFLAKLEVLGTLVMPNLLAVSLSCLWILCLPNANTNTIDTYLIMLLHLPLQPTLIWASNLINQLLIKLKELNLWTRSTTS